MSPHPRIRNFSFLLGAQAQSQPSLLQRLLSWAFQPWFTNIFKIFCPKILLATIRSVITSLSRKLRPVDIIMTPEMEEKYWKKSFLSRQRLQSTDARYVDSNGLLKKETSTLPPLVMYYIPALPKECRKNPGKLKKYHLSPHDYCKWHRMVFPGKDHPTIAQAARLRKMHDPEELREIHRISRMLPDSNTSQLWAPKYQKKWLKWRELRRQALEKL